MLLPLRYLKEITTISQFILTRVGLLVFFSFIPDMVGLCKPVHETLQYRTGTRLMPVSAKNPHTDTDTCEAVPMDGSRRNRV